jgi:hypothetical protein
MGDATVLLNQTKVYVLGIRKTGKPSRGDLKESLGRKIPNATATSLLKIAVKSDPHA